MRTSSLIDVEGDYPQKNPLEQDPFKIHDQPGDDALLVKPISERCERDVPKAIEDDNDSKIDLEGIDTVLIEIPIEPSNKEIVCQCQDPRRADRVICSDVRHNGELGRQWHT